MKSFHAAALAAGIALFTADLRAADDLFEDKVVVKGGDWTILQSELDQAFVQRKAQMAAMGLEVPETRRLELEKETLNLLILKKLLLDQATAQDLEKAQSMVDQQIAVKGEEALEQQAKLFGLTTEAFKKELIEQTQATQVIERDFRPKVEVTTEEAREFYDENVARFETPEQVRSAHILFQTRDQQGQELSQEAKDAKRAAAEKVLERAKKGEDFAALAREFSEDPGSRENGGEYTFPRGRMVPEFEKAAFALQPNQVSDLVTTQFGYHIIKTYEHLPASLQPFEEAEPQIKNFLGRQELQQVLQDYVAQVKQNGEVDILSERLSE